MQLNCIYKSVLLASISLSLNWLSVEAKAKPRNAILLSDVQTLTFRKDGMTAHRRVPAIPQLKCVGGSGKGLYEPDVVRCSNSGSSYDREDVEWTCTASLPEELKLGSTEVVCEGYDSPDDPYILKGSCGLEYRLVLTDKGQKSSYAQNLLNNMRRHDGEGSQSAIPPFFFWILFFGLLAFMIWSAYKNRNSAQQGFRRQGRRTGSYWSGGGGDDDGGDDPPPPYSQFPQNPRSKGSFWSNFMGAGPSGYGNASNSGWRPGFGTGAALGGAAGYAAGRAHAESSRRAQSRPSGMTQTSSSSSSFGSSSRHSSTGFGGTRRR